MIASNFKKQVSLLLEVLEDALEDERVALKGGTAINLFIENMPRMSVDIDLVYLPLAGRDQALTEIDAIMRGIQARIQSKPRMFVTMKLTQTNIPKQLRVVQEDTAIKIEINLVLRGSVFDTVRMRVCEKAEEVFQKSASVAVLSFEEVYAGKFCAALDRQHPRDLFDVKGFLQKHTFTEKLKKAFLVYLISGNRPISELIFPNLLDQRKLFEQDFVGMVDMDVTYAALEKARIDLINLIDQNLTTEDRQFLLSLKSGNPNWDLLGVEHAEQLPAVKWKLANIQKMSKVGQQNAFEELKRKLKM